MLEEEIRKQKPPIMETKTVTVNDLVTEQSSTISYNQPEIEYRDMSVDKDPSNNDAEESKTSVPSKEIKDKDPSANKIAITNVDDNNNNESMIDMIKHHNISLPSASRLVDDSFG